MWNLIVGFFKEYWGVLLTCAFMQYYIPRSDGALLDRYIKWRVRRVRAKRALKADPTHSLR
jgi:hypothetical protein